MRTIIAGSRGISLPTIIQDAVKASGFIVTTVISGTARGIDQLGEQWAVQNNIPVIRYPAQWSQYGKRAGYLRNEAMAANADALIAVWDGVSKGTGHMIDIATARGLRVYVHKV